MKKIIFWFLSLAVFAIFNYEIYAHEQIKANGEPVFLELAPVDPRSLMQGDYMRLRYAVERSALPSTPGQRDKRGYLVITVDDKHVGKFDRFYSGEALKPNEKLLRYHDEYSQIRIVPDSFMFQEGQSALYRKAKYGEFKFDAKGDHLLVGLADETLQPIKPE